MALALSKQTTFCIGSVLEIRKSQWSYLNVHDVRYNYWLTCLYSPKHIDPHTNQFCRGEGGGAGIKCPNKNVVSPIRKMALS